MELEFKDVCRSVERAVTCLKSKEPVEERCLYLLHLTLLFYYVNPQEGGRLDRWLAHFATLVDGKPRYLFGDTITYADCALFHVLDAAMSQFPDAWDEPSREKLRAALEPYMKLITMHVTLGAYLKADDRAPWAGDSMM